MMQNIATSFIKNEKKKFEILESATIGSSSQLQRKGCTARAFSKEGKEEVSHHDKARRLQMSNSTFKHSKKEGA